MEHMDIFNDDAFSLVSLTAAINEVDHVPGRAGQLAFAGVGEGVSTDTITIERKGVALTLIQTSKRGGPAPKEEANKANLRSVNIPHIALEDTIQASEVAGVREFGTTDQLRTVQNTVNGRLAKMAARHDLTLEHHRLGALRGKILDADGSTLTDLFELFGVTNSDAQAEPEAFDFGLDASDSGAEDLRITCQKISRFIKRKAKMVLPGGARVHAFCGDDFFDALISREDVKRTFLQTAEQTVRLGGNFAFSAFEYGGIVFENYQGTDDGGDADASDGGTVGIARDEAVLFLTGVPGLYVEYFAPGDFMETVNTKGLPRYAKQAPDPRFNRFVELHTQQNPLPLCLRPQTLCVGLM